MSNVEQQGQELSYRLRVRMAPVDGTYKIDNIEPVSK
jgi:Mce-associated membrane protein